MTSLNWPIDSLTAAKHSLPSRRLNAAHDECAHSERTNKPREPGRVALGARSAEGVPPWGQPSVARASAAPLHMALHIPSRCETWRAAAHRAEPSAWPSILGNREISRETGTAGPRGGGCCASELVSRPTPLRAWTLGTCRARVSAAIRVSVRVRIRVRVRVWVRGLEFASIFPGAHLQAKRTGGHSREGDAGAGSSARGLPAERR